MTLWQLDQSWFRAIHEGWRQEWLDPAMRLVTDTGLGTVQVPVLLLLLLWRRARPYASACLGAFALSGVVRLAIMRWADRMRPSNFEFAHPLESVFGNTSFPSGHTTTSFAIAFTLVLMTRQSRAWVGWAALGWACLVGLSRIYVGVHYPTDVAGGAALGLASAAAIQLWRRRNAVSN